jgi:hypothetical protein
MRRSPVFAWPQAVLLFVLVSASACAGETPPAPSTSSGAPTVDRVRSVAGVPDRGDDPPIVALAAPGRVLCAGTLVAPDIVMTASACVPPAVSTLRVLVPVGGDQLADMVERARGFALLDAPVTGATELAFVLLDEPMDDVAPLSIRATGVAQGDHVRTVGFAATGKVVRDHVAVVGSDDRAFDVDEAACLAARGSPALDESTSDVVGVLASAGADCVPRSGRDVYERADRALPSVAQTLARARGGIAKGAAKTKKGPIDMGAACLHGAECASGVCVATSGAQYCSRSCGAVDTCPAHFKCMNTQENVTVCVER